MSDTSDLYDLVEYAQRGGYQGSVIKFYDFENGNVYTPFEKKRDVIYSKPAYVDGFYYFLQNEPSNVIPFPLDAVKMDDSIKTSIYSGG